MTSNYPTFKDSMFILLWMPLYASPPCTNHNRRNHNLPVYLDDLCRISRLHWVPAETSSDHSVHLSYQNITR